MNNNCEYFYCSYINEQGADHSRIYRADHNTNDLSYRHAKQPNDTSPSSASFQQFIDCIRNGDTEQLKHSGLGGFQKIELVTKDYANKICKEWYKKNVL